jgi:alpha-mannosidase
VQKSEAARIENEYYIVTPTGVTDKATGKVLLGAAGHMVVSHDFGHAWGRLQEEGWILSLPDATAHTEQGDGYTTLVLTGGYTDPARGIASLRWTRTLTLYPGINKIFCRTAMDWKGESVHVYARFPLCFDHGKSAFYEVPYGMVERDDVIEPSKMLGIEDEWPALNWFAAYDRADERSVIVYNKGTPGCRVRADGLEMSLLRSPTSLEFANEGARDHGEHVAEYAIEICDGAPTSAVPAAFGLRYTTPTISIAASPKQDGAQAAPLLPIDTKGSSLHLTAIKRDEAGALIARVYESCGSAQTLVLPKGMMAREVDPLEERVLSEEIGTLYFRPFEIKTIRLVE